MDANRPEMPQSLHIQCLELELEAAKLKADGYQKLFLSVLGNTNATTSMHPRATSQQPQPLPQPQPSSSSTARDPGASVASAQAPASGSSSAPISASAPGPARPERLIRASRREVVTRQPIARRLTRSQALISRNEGPGGSSNHISTFSTRNTHENEVTNDIPAAIREIVEAGGLTPYLLSQGEVECAKRTPRILRSILSKMFGGFRMSEFRSEWLNCHLNDESFFLMDPLAQPFAPTSIGCQGLALLSPAWTQNCDDEEGSMFHAFLSQSKGTKGSNLLEYMGDYTRVPLLQKTIDWSLIPKTTQRIWLKRMYGFKSIAGCELRARIKLREILKREPSVAEVKRRLQHTQDRDVVRWAELSSAFMSGKEKMWVVGIKCERYDSHLASKIQKEVADLVAE